MAKIVKGDKAPEGELTITPVTGEQFTVSDSDGYTTDNEGVLASLSAEVANGVLKVEYDEEVDKEEAARKEAEKEARAAAKKRATEIKQGKPLEELTPVPGTSQGDPAEVAARDDQGDKD